MTTAMQPGNLSLFYSDNKYFPRLKLYTSSSNPVKTGKIPMNHYAATIGKDQVRVLGAEVIVQPMAVLIQALDFSTFKVDKKLKVNYDPQSADFADMSRRSIKEKGSNTMPPCAVGPLFLLYCPAFEGFLTYFLGTYSERNITRPLEVAMHGRSPVRLSSEMRTGTYTYQVPIALKYQGEIDLPSDSASYINQFMSVQGTGTTEKEADMEGDLEVGR